MWVRVMGLEPEVKGIRCRLHLEPSTLSDVRHLCMSVCQILEACFENLLAAECDIEGVDVKNLVRLMGHTVFVGFR